MTKKDDKKQAEEQYKEVEVNLDDETFLKIAKIAHAHDVTFNQICNRILRGYIVEQEAQERFKK